MFVLLTHLFHYDFYLILSFTSLLKYRNESTFLDKTIKKVPYFLTEDSSNLRFIFNKPKQTFDSFSEVGKIKS